MTTRAIRWSCGVAVCVVALGAVRARGVEPLVVAPVITTSPLAFVTVTGDRLIEPVRSFGQPYRATPDDDEFECEYNGTAEPGDVVAVGSAANAGRFLEADLEGLSLIASVPGR